MNVTLRPVTPEDSDFLYRVFAAVRGAYFQQFGLAPAQLEPLLHMQYRAQTDAYRQHDAAGHSIVLVDGAPAGRLWLDRGPDRRHIVDISLLPEYQSRGIGAALIRDAIAEASAAGVPLVAEVAHDNPGSLRFHQRLGFDIVGEDQVYYRLERKP